MVAASWADALLHEMLKSLFRSRVNGAGVIDLHFDLTDPCPTTLSSTVSQPLHCRLMVDLFLQVLLSSC